MDISFINSFFILICFWFMLANNMALRSYFAINSRNNKKKAAIEDLSDMELKKQYSYLYNKKQYTYKYVKKQ